MPIRKHKKQFAETDRLGNPRQRLTEINALPIRVCLEAREAELLGWGFYRRKYWRNHFHSHSYYEVCYAYGGEGVYRSGDQELPFRKGNLSIARPGIVHEIISSRKKPLGIYFWSYTLTPAAKKSSDKNISKLFDAFESSSEVMVKKAPHVLPMLEMLTSEVVRKAPGMANSLDLLVCQLLLEVARDSVNNIHVSEDFQSLATDASSYRVSGAIRFLRDNYHRSISTRDVAMQMNISPRQMSRLFMENKGVSIRDYLLHLRMDVAAQKLLESDTSIKEVASACGYSNARHFITIFRKTFGCPPGEYRRHGGTSFI